jgi:hypothetical protein
LFIEKDLELPHDILFIREAMNNRRADGGRLDLQQSIISCLHKIISTTADVCEAFLCNPCILWFKIFVSFRAFRG